MIRNEYHGAFETAKINGSFVLFSTTVQKLEDKWCTMKKQSRIWLKIKQVYELPENGLSAHLTFNFEFASAHRITFRKAFLGPKTKVGISLEFAFKNILLLACSRTSFKARFRGDSHRNINRDMHAVMHC